MEGRGLITTFITTLANSGDGQRLAVKDIIDVIGLPTTAGSKAVASVAQPAKHDAALLAGARAAGCRIVGKANLHELAFGASGVNLFFGTPQNPFDRRLVPGGSSSGSAVAIAVEAADIAFGSDTGGSIRVPAAFCGVVGLKTTHGRIPMEGVRPLAPSFDTVGPMARDVSGVAEGMALLEPGFVPAYQPATTIGRLRVPGISVDPVIEAAVDEALAISGVAVVEVELPEWQTAGQLCMHLIESEAANSNRSLLEDPALASQLSAPIAARLQGGAAVSVELVASARAFQREWKKRLEDLTNVVELLALPSVPFFAPPLQDASARVYWRYTSPVNLSGLPALALPVPSAHRLPASLQLVGLTGGEEMLCATGSVIERACAAGT